MRTKSHKQKILTRSFMSFMDNDLTTAAAAISYFSMLTLFPTLLLLLTIGNRLFGPETVEKYVIGQVLAFLPGAQTFVRKNLESISEISTSVIISCVMVMLWAASWMFMVIEKALNRVWGTYPRSFLHGRVWNIAVMSLVWALLAASAVFTAFVTGVQAAAGKIHLRLGPWFTALTGYAWQTIFIVAGAVIAGVLWEGAKFGFAFLLPYFHYDLLYGSIGAGVALLSWVYLSSVIMMFGAQFTALLHRDHLYEPANKDIHPTTGELPIRVEEVAGGMKEIRKDEG
jgi:membrane protein